MGNRTLLLVDDEENIAAALTRLLRRDGYKILRANSGHDGLQLLHENEVGVIISDQRMPGMTGVEFLSEVKKRYPETARMVLSGYTDLNSVTDAINRGEVYKFLTKPWNDDLLRENVAEAFDYFELKSENKRLTAELLEANKALESRMLIEAGNARSNLIVLEMAQEILDNLPVGVLGIDDNGMLVLANSKAQQLLAFRRGIVVGDFVRDILPEELTDLYAQADGTATTSPVIVIGDERVKVLCSYLGRSSSGHGTVLTLLPMGEDMASEE
jgi:FixJ family two-component response regulator